MPRRLRLLTIATSAFALRALACSLNQDPSLLAEAGAGAGDATNEGEGGPGTGTSDDGSASSNDGGAGGDAPTAPPSYCQGLTFLVGFDQGLSPDLGDTSPRVVGDIGAAPGHFGNAASMVMDAGSDADIVFYDTHDGGTPFYAANEGTIAFWFRRVVPAPGTTAFVRPVVSTTLLNAAGPVVETAFGEIGIALDLGKPPFAGLSLLQMAPYVRSGDFNHYVFAWHESDDAGAGGLGLVAVNGGLGEVMVDAGDEAGTAEAGADDGGTYSSPYFVRRPANLPSRPPLASLRLGGNITTSPRGEMDDFAVWNRVLSRTEIADVYRSTASLRTACAIP